MAAKKKEENNIDDNFSKDVLSSFLKNNEEDHLNFVEPESRIISTGSLQLDSLIKVRSGSIVRLAGKGAELGKTSQCFVLAKNYMDTMPKSKTLFIKAEARLGPEMQARSGHKFVTDPSQWDYGTVFVYCSNVFESIASLIESLLPSMQKNGEHLCIILDSLDGVILKADKEKNLWTGEESVKVAGVPALSKILFRRLALQINHFDALFLITCQYSAEIKLDPYSKVPARQGDASGGNAVNHQNDITLSYALRNASDYIYEYPDQKPDASKNKCLGVYATIDIRKSNTDVTGTRVKIPIAKGRIGNCIWKEKEVVDMAIAFGLLSKRGSWFSFEESLVNQAAKEGVDILVQHQGLKAVYKYIEENPNIFQWMYDKFSSLVN